MYLKIKKKTFPRFATFSSCLLTDMGHLANFALQSIPPLYIYIHQVPTGTSLKHMLWEDIGR